VAKYQGAWDAFDFSVIRTYPIADRPNKVTLADQIDLRKLRPAGDMACTPTLSRVAEAILAARRQSCPVIWMMGAHPVKLGLSPIIIDLMERGLITHVAGNGAVSIHDFELALIGETSENVPNALPKGQFGMARETGQLINNALAEGYRRGLGWGEAMGRLILGEPMPESIAFRHPDASIQAAGIRLGIPVTIHAGIGTDIIDQHPNFDGAMKGGASGFDFAVYAASVARLSEGGVVLNVGSAVTGPEVFLKAISMVCNSGTPLGAITTANFDLRPVVPDDVNNEDKPTYYFRDNKSVVTRVPSAFGGQGYYVQGHFSDTLPALYRALIREE
jgi:hypothetical protein